ncbi:MAG: thioredoxin domain-containing protein [Desulfobacterales bacterium]|jgi:uncharacterized protein YyaL (SSP411 family)|nr:thioredoxin domain-containing protein [Desulfobacterales bacterium]
MTFENHLIREKSPYLRQHAHQPVDWHPWGPDALALARRLDRPILLSSGYSTCHWCHVMAHESFDDPAVARRMNDAFVCIKLDREERPDIDKLYITAVSALTGSAGWPLNVFLTPDLKPFFGGTYFPPTSRFGTVAWPDLVDHIARLWQDPDQRRRLRQSAESITAAVVAHLNGSRSGAVSGGPNPVAAARQALAQRYDRQNGGFGPAPKFPSPSLLTFLIAEGDARGARAGDDPEGLDMALETLRRMIRGGIYDQVGGGFHRYSVDERWHVPHFEKMLYDNAQLAGVLLEAHRVSGDEMFARAAMETLNYLLRDLQGPEGGFFAAEDADSPVSGDPAAPAREGAFYVWDHGAVDRLLDPADAALWAYRFGMQPTGNVVDDPHGMFTGQNVLFAAQGIEAAARHFNLEALEVQRRLDAARNVLMTAREQRPRPHRDEKIVAEANGLAISALAKAAGHFKDSENGARYQEAAVRAATFVQKHLYDAVAHRLKRRWCDGAAGIDAMATDYAFLAQGLADLYAATADTRWRDWAEQLADVFLERFQDPDGGLFLTSVDAADVPLTRIKEDSDSVIPSASSVAALVMRRLAAWTGRDDLRAAARRTVDAVLAHLGQSPEAAAMMLTARLKAGRTKE